MFALTEKEAQRASTVVIVIRTAPADPYGLDPPIVFESESSVVCILHFIRVHFDILLSSLSKGCHKSLSL